MDFSFTEEQSMLRDTLASYLADHYDFEARKAAIRTPEGMRPAVWSAFAQDLGILGASFAEEHGGLGGGPVETMIVMEELGKSLVVEPYLSTVVIGGGFLKRAGDTGADLIGQIISGDARFAFAYAEPQGRYNLADLKTIAKKDGEGYVLDGRKAVVRGAPFATHLIVTARTGGAQRDAGGVGVFLVPKGAKGVSTTDYATVDGGRASEILFENVRAEAVLALDGLNVVEAVVDEAIAALCAEAVGVQRQLHQGTLDYARQRKQFGVPIASFQVLQHRMVDMFMGLEQSVSMTYMATLKLEQDDAERKKAVSAAKVQVGRANKFLGQSAIQIFGGMGMTDEMFIGHYFKRATMIEGEFGSVDHHLKRYEDLSFGAAA